MKGKVEVKITRRDDLLEFVVEDTGVGISADGLKELFSVFGKGEDLQGLNNGGSGLDLAICKKIIDKMEGDIHIESQEGKGTVSLFTI
jgi:signal transduction histidine kinase